MDFEYDDYVCFKKRFFTVNGICLLLAGSAIYPETSELDSAVTLLKQKNNPRSLTLQSGLLRNKHPKKIRQEFKSLVDFRKAVVDTVLYILRNEPDNAYSMEFALKLAGEYRIEEASDLLIEKITVPITSGSTTRESYIWYPAVGAICKIGISACSKILGKVDGNEENERLILYAYCMRCCYSDNGIFIREYGRPYWN